MREYGNPKLRVFRQNGAVPLTPPVWIGRPQRKRKGEFITLLGSVAVQKMPQIFDHARRAFDRFRQSPVLNIPLHVFALFFRDKDVQLFTKHAVDSSSHLTPYPASSGLPFMITSRLLSHPFLFGPLTALPLVLLIDLKFFPVHFSTSRSRVVVCSVFLRSAVRFLPAGGHSADASPAVQSSSSLFAFVNIGNTGLIHRIVLLRKPDKSPSDTTIKCLRVGLSELGEFFVCRPPQHFVPVFGIELKIFPVRHASFSLSLDSGQDLYLLRVRNIRLDSLQRVELEVLDNEKAVGILPTASTVPNER
jgi:hypothetical protein